MFVPILQHAVLVRKILTLTNRVDLKMRKIPTSCGTCSRLCNEKRATVQKAEVFKVFSHKADIPTDFAQTFIVVYTSFDTNT